MYSRQLFLVSRVIKTSHPSSQTPNYPSITDLCQKIWLREKGGRVRLLQTLVPLVLSPKKLWFPFSYNNLIVSCQFTLPKPVLVNNKKEIDLSTSLSANFVSFWSKVCFELTGNSFRRKVNCAVYRRGRLLYNSARTNQPTCLLLTWLISYKKLTVVLFMSTTDLYDNNKQYFFDVLVFLDL